MPKNAQQFVQALHAQAKGVEREIKALEAEQKAARADLARVGTEIEQAWTHLISVLVPSLSPAPLNATASRIRLRELEHAFVSNRMNQERAALLREQAALAGHPLFRDREAKRNEASIRLAEVEEALAPLEHSVHELECAPLFLEVFQSGYGTEGYAQKFWQLSYYRHWKHADLILEVHGKRLAVEDFSALRDKYVNEKSAITPLTATRDEWRRLVQDVADLEEKHGRVVQALESLEVRTLVWARGRVREHLNSMPPDELHRLLGNDEELRVALARMLGVEAKRRYLDDMLLNLIKPPLDDLRAALAKAHRDIAKLKRPKNYGRTFSDEEFQRRFGRDRTAAWNKRRTRIHDARTHVVAFHDYDRWSPARDFLWWDLMTDGRLDGDFISEVRERGPRHRHDVDAAAVASASSREDLALDVS
jgi:hypothetical protein